MAIKAPITGRAGTNLTVAIHYWPQLDKANADDDIYHQYTMTWTNAEVSQTGEDGDGAVAH